MILASLRQVVDKSGITPPAMATSISSGGVDNEKIWDLAPRGNLWFGAGLRQ
jgi:hypothetical protein